MPTPPTSFARRSQKDPSNAEAYLGLATSPRKASTAKPPNMLAKAIELDPKLAEAHELLADLALANDDREAAAAEADKAIALESDALDAMAIHAALELHRRPLSRCVVRKDSRRSIPVTARHTHASRISLSCTIATRMRSPTTARRSRPIRACGRRIQRWASI